MSKKKHELSALQASHCINVGVFLVVIAIMGLAAVFLPKPTVSEYEKRELEQFPEFSLESLFSGEYTEKLKFEVVGNPVEMKQSMKEDTCRQAKELAKAMADRLKADR